MAANAERPQPRFDWFIPIDGDGAHIGTLRAERPPTFEYLREVVQAAGDEGYDSLLIPTRFVNGLFDEQAPLAETWTTATALAAVTSRIRFLVAVRLGFISPGLFAQMAAALDQISQGRLDLNIVPGGIAGEFERLGEQIDHDTRYERAEEFIAALRALWQKPEPVVFNGRTIRLNGALVSPGPLKTNGSVGVGPQFYVGGASPRTSFSPGFSRWTRSRPCLNARGRSSRPTDAGRCLGSAPTSSCGRASPPRGRQPVSFSRRRPRR